MAVSAMQLVGRISIDGADKAENQLKQVDLQGKRAQSTLDHLHPSSVNTGKAFGVQLAGGMKTATGGILDFASKASLAGMGIVGLAKGAATLAGAFFAPNASLEQMRVSFGAFIEDADQLEATMAGLKKFATTTPFETPEINKAALALLNMDLQAQDLTKWLGNIGAAVAKIGGNGQAFEDITQIISQMGLESKITYGEMQQLQERNIPAWKTLAKVMGVSVAQAKEMVSTNNEMIMGADKVEKFVEALGKFGGDAMVQQSKTWNGMLSTIADTARDIWVAFTGPLFEKARSAMGSMLDIVSLNQTSIMQFVAGAGKALGDIFGGLGDVVQRNVVPWFREFMQVLGQPAFQSFVSALGEVWEQLKDVGAAFLDLWTSISPVNTTLSTLGSLFQSNSKDVLAEHTSLDILAKTFRSLGDFIHNHVAPAIDVFGDILATDVVPAFKEAHKIGQDFLEKVFKALAPIIERIVPPLLHFSEIIAVKLLEGMRFLTPYILDATKSIAGFAGEIVDRVGPIVTQWLDSLGATFKMIKDGWMVGWPVMSDLLRGVWDGIVGIVKVAWALVSGVLKIGLDLMRGDWGAIWGDMKDMLFGVWDGIKTYLKGELEFLAGLFKPLLQSASTVPGPIGDMAKSVLESLDSLTGGVALKTREAKEKADLHTLEMKIASIKNAEATELGVIQKFDRMRMGIADQLTKTKDEAEKHALEIKLKHVTHAEDAAVKTWESHKKMRQNAEGEHAKLKKSIEDNSGGIIGSIQRFFGGIGQWFADRFNEAKTGVTGAFGAIGQWFQDRWVDVQNIWGGVGQWFQDRGRDIWGGITGFFGAIGKWFQDRWNEVMNTTAPFRNYMGAVFETIWNILVALWGKLGAKFNQWLEEAKAFFAPFVNTVRDKFNEAWNAVVGAFQFLGNWFGDRWNEAKTKLAEAGGFFRDKFMEGWNYVTGIWNFLGKFFSDKWEETKQKLAPIGNYIRDKFQEGWNHVVNIFSPLGRTFQGYWNEVTSGIERMKKDSEAKFNALKDSVGNIFRGLVNGIVDQLNNGIHTVERFINAIGQGLNSIATSLGTKGTIPVAHLGRIPRYARGTDSHPGGLMWTGEEGPELTWAPPGTKVIPHKESMQLAAMMGGKIPGYAEGIGDLGSKIIGWIGGGAKAVLDNVMRAMNIGVPSLPGMGNIAGAIFDKVKSWAVGFVDKILPKFDFGAPGGGAVPGNLQQWIAQAMGITKVPGSWAGALATIAMRESGGNPKAINNWDSNAQRGDPSRGLFQTIGATFRAHALPGMGDIFNPVHNAIAAIRYIIGRYGTVFNVPGIVALSQGRPYVGYANGGMINEPIMGLGLRTGTRYTFGERGREMVLPYVPPGVNLSSQASSVAPAPASGGNQTIILEVDGQRLGRIIMPLMVEQIRNRVGVRF